MRCESCGTDGVENSMGQFVSNDWLRCQKLQSEINALKEDNAWQIKQNVRMFTALEEITKADGTPEKPKHVSRSALIQIAKNGIVESV